MLKSSYLACMFTLTVEYSEDKRTLSLLGHILGLVPGIGVQRMGGVHYLDLISVSDFD